MIRSTVFVLLSLALLPSTPAAQGERLGPDGMLEQARRFLPEYDGEHRWFLSEDARAETSAAAHLLEAAVSLDPRHVRAHWWLGHTQVLLAEDRRSRGLGDEARRHSERASWALGRAIELQPDDPWAWYARATARTAAGEHAAALRDLERAVELLEAGETRDEWLRYKALGWRAEVQMRTGDHAAARERLRAYHREFSTNDWPLLIALSESHLRERDLSGARERYEEILEAFPSDPQAYALLAYVEGLLGDRERATERLIEALERELQPELYTRLWFVLLATESARPAAVQDLEGFLENPPPAPTEWDLALGRFVLGGEEVAQFLQRVEEETKRRMEAAQPLDDLECEAWFYVGLRLELDAWAAGPELGGHLRKEALAAHRRALGFRPTGWKWEWAFARLRFADLAQELGGSPSPLLSTGVATVPAKGLTDLVTGLRWHAPRSGSATEELARELRPGDLALGLLERGEGEREAVLLLVDVEL